MLPVRIRPLNPPAAIVLAVAAALTTSLTALPAAAINGGSSERSIRAAPGERPYAPRLSCATVAGLVARTGVVVVDTGPHTFDRVVRDVSLCPVEQTTVPDFVSTADVRSCFVGYRCQDRQTEGTGRD